MISYEQRRLRGRTVLAIDVESTGVRNHDRMVEIAVVRIPALLEDDTPEVVFSSLVNPEMAIPPDATRIHGITDAMVASAPTWAQVCERIGERLCDPEIVLCAHNAEFDHRFVSRGLPLLADGRRWLDTMKAVQRIDDCRYQRGMATLAASCDRRGLEPGAHRAAGDALACARLLPVLVREAYGLGDDRPPDRPSVAEWLGWQEGQRFFWVDGKEAGG